MPRRRPPAACVTNIDKLWIVAGCGSVTDWTSSSFPFPLSVSPMVEAVSPIVNVPGGGGGAGKDEQFALVPPPEPRHDHDHGPAPETDVAVPALHRLTGGDDNIM